MKGINRESAAGASLRTARGSLAIAVVGFGLLVGLTANAGQQAGVDCTVVGGSASPNSGGWYAGSSGATLYCGINDTRDPVNQDVNSTITNVDVHFHGTGSGTASCTLYSRFASGSVATTSRGVSGSGYRVASMSNLTRRVPGAAYLRCTMPASWQLRAVTHEE